MKKELLNIISCKCKGKFILKNCTEKHNEIYSATLECSGCKAQFPIKNYIPRLIDDYNYSESWGVLWKETGAILRDSFTGTPWHYNAIHGKYSEAAGENLSPFGFEWPTDMHGKKILEIGPGTGNCTEHLVNTGADVLCVDMSEAIDTFSEELLTKPNINVIQCDINKGFIPENYFDRIWLFQVLQHTPAPPETLKNIRKFLKPGGEIAFTSYSSSFNPWYYRFTKKVNNQLSWNLISKWIPVLIPVKYRLQKFFCIIRLPVMAKVIRVLFGPIDPRDVYFRTLEGLADNYVMGMMWKKTRDKELLMKYVIINTFDAITPEYTNCCKDEELMEEWLKDAKYSTYKIWGVTGLRVRAIK